MANEITRIKKSNTVVPRSLTQADILLGSLGETQDSINAIERELKAEIDKLKKEALKKLQPLTVRRDNQINALFSFANPRKAELTKKVRSIVLSSGTFGWRMTPPRVEIDCCDEEMIEYLKNSGNEEFVRVIEEIDRQTLLAERPLINGISYKQSDEFFVVPRQTAKKPKTFTKAIDREDG
jgi:phage host-nuclease inhibitor protein Gam